MGQVYDQESSGLDLDTETIINQPSWLFVVQSAQIEPRLSHCGTEVILDELIQQRIAVLHRHERSIASGPAP